jgi:hypothetical protein
VQTGSGRGRVPDRSPRAAHVDTEWPRPPEQAGTYDTHCHCTSSCSLDAAGHQPFPHKSYLTRALQRYRGARTRGGSVARAHAPQAPRGSRLPPPCDLRCWPAGGGRAAWRWGWSRGDLRALAAVEAAGPGQGGGEGRRSGVEARRSGLGFRRGVEVAAGREVGEVRKGGLARRGRLVGGQSAARSPPAVGGGGGRRWAAPVQYGCRRG